jgi:hypothetical protein
MPAPVEGEERPYFPYSILCADHESGFLFGTALAEPSDWETKFSPCILDCIEEHDLLPSALWVRKKELHELFESLASRLGIEVRLTRNLPAIDRAKRAMLKYFKNRR